IFQKYTRCHHHKSKSIMLLLREIHIKDFIIMIRKENIIFSNETKFAKL
ncbi:hypothetical protein BLOT_007154, partial [Blomia tropicalis]